MYKEKLKHYLFRFKLWCSNLRKNWILYILNLILYLFPVVVIEPSIFECIVGKFTYVIALVVVIFIVNEFIKSKELMKNEYELNSTRESIKNLEKELYELECYSESIGLFLENLPKDFLRSVSEFLKLRNSERISLYVLVDDKKFRIIGRYSENPKYDRNGRCEYPSDCGYISKCLENDNGKSYYYIDKLPQKLNQYLQRVSKDTGMSEDEIKNLSMKSRTYFTRLIKDRNNKNVGVLVVESTKAMLPMSVGELNTKLEELIISHLSTFLDISNKLKGVYSNG